MLPPVLAKIIASIKSSKSGVSRGAFFIEVSEAIPDS
jgi:hypothetical protein